MIKDLDEYCLRTKRFNLYRLRFVRSEAANGCDEEMFINDAKNKPQRSKLGDASVMGKFLTVTKDVMPFSEKLIN